MTNPAARITADQCREYLENNTFLLRSAEYAQHYPKWPGAVGLEVEMLPVRPQQGRGNPAVASQRVIAETLKGLVGKEPGWESAVEESLEDGSTLITAIQLNSGAVTFEPGGQVEFSTKPFPCLLESMAELTKVQTTLAKTLDPLGIQLTQVGINPWHTPQEIGLQMAKHRYQAMDAYFRALSPFGQRMMRQTCTIQVCLDFGPTEESMAKRFLASQLLAPFATALFAFSGFVDGQAAGMPGLRSEVWRHLDGTRTGYPNLDVLFKKLNKAACVETYLQFALDARVVFVQNLHYRVVSEPVSFRKWMNEGLWGMYPTEQDFWLHLSLLFPEVRPKGFLELRSVDCQARVFQAIPAAFYTALLYDDKNLNAVIDRLMEYKGRLDELLAFAKNGLSHPVLNKEAKALMAIADDGISRQPSCFKGEGILAAFRTFKSQLTDQGLTPADALLKHASKTHPTAPSFDVLQSWNNRWAELVHANA